MTAVSTTKPKPPPPPPKINGLRRKPEVKAERVNVKDVGYPLPMRSQYEPEWLARLKDAGYPTTVVVIDFETYFDDVVSMRGDKLSTIEYVQHPDFEILGCSTFTAYAPFLDPDKFTRWWGGEGGVEQMIEHLQREYGPNLERCTVVAQNARFESTVLAWHFGIWPPYSIDTLGLARHWSSRRNNDLGNLCKVEGLTHKGDTSEFKGWTNRSRFIKPKGRKKGPKLPLQAPRMTPEQQRKLADYANNDVAREWELFTIYLPRLSNFVTELRVMHHTLELFSKPTFHVDEALAEDIKTKMLAEIDKAVEPTGLTEEQVRKGTWDEEMFAALEAAGDDPNAYTKPAGNCKRGWKIASAKTDPEREQLEVHPNDGVRNLMLAKAAVDSWPNHIKRVDRIVRQARAAGGALPVPLKYHGAHTGRWSGGERINLQNLGSRGHGLVNQIRELLIAPPGTELVIADASQIEARVLAWLAGQWDLCEKFANGEEIYCGFASKVLGRYVRKPRPDGIPMVEAWFKWARNSVGKVGVLGCGYGMGPAKTVGYAKGAIDDETGTKIVKVYREDNDRIVQFWRDIEKAFVYTARYKEPCSLPRGVSFHSTPDCDVVMTLPSGREIKYAEVRIEDDRYSPRISVYNALQRGWDHVWGGHLTENVVQAISRDILWGAIEKLEDDGHHVPHHVHDELIACVPEGRGEKVLTLAVKYLRARPEWAADLPLDAEGVVTTRYGGH